MRITKNVISSGPDVEVGCGNQGHPFMTSCGFQGLEYLVDSGFFLTMAVKPFLRL